MYIYIYIERERERERVLAREIPYRMMPPLTLSLLTLLDSNFPGHPEWT